VNPYRVKTAAEICEQLERLGFIKTDRETQTGVVWRSVQNGRHLIVPHPYDGMYPDFILGDLKGLIEKLGQSTIH
jgi:hypothetical protein